MGQRLGLNKQKTISLLLGASLLASSIWTSFQHFSFADDTAQTLVRTVPMDISNYPEAKDLDSKVATADGTLEVITKTSPVLLVHMEAIRLAYTKFGSNTAETQKFLTALKDRYMKNQNDASSFFDYGYAQLVMENDKNGLFFLRKANDKLKSPFTALAYGLAQIDIDKNQEKASVDDLTTRKMDVMYKLKDALTLNRNAVLTGVWPSYINIAQAVKDYPAYKPLQTEDESVFYVPYGAIPGAPSTAETDTQFLALASPITKIDDNDKTPAPDTSWIDTSCQFTAPTLDWSKLAFNQAVDINNDGKNDNVYFFKTTTAGAPYQVIVVNEKNTVIGEFSSNKGPYIIEDLDGDKDYEFVVRQFDVTPADPIHVYRWNGKCIQEDKRVLSYFK